MKKNYSNPQTEQVFFCCSNVMNKPGVARYGTPTGEPGGTSGNGGTIMSTSSHE